jgi:hypothetical protein
MLVPSLAFADGGSSAPLGLWPSLAILGCTAVSYLLRRYAPAGHFFHAPLGAVILSLLSGLATAVQGAIQAHGLNGQAIAAAAIGAAMSLFATSNPSVPVGSQAPMRNKPPLASIIALVMIPAYLGACVPLSECKTPTPSQVQKCQLEHDLISCGEQSAFNLLPVLVEIIASTIAGNFDPNSLIGLLEAQGVKNVPCVLAALERYAEPIAPMFASRIHVALRVALAKQGKHGKVTIKLAGGHTRDFVVDGGGAK